MVVTTIRTIAVMLLLRSKCFLFREAFTSHVQGPPTGGGFLHDNTIYIHFLKVGWRSGVVEEI